MMYWFTTFQNIQSILTKVLQYFDQGSMVGLVAQVLRLHSFGMGHKPFPTTIPRNLLVGMEFAVVHQILVHVSIQTLLPDLLLNLLLVRHHIEFGDFSI